MSVWLSTSLRRQFLRRKILRLRSPLLLHRYRLLFLQRRQPSSCCPFPAPLVIRKRLAVNRQRVLPPRAFQEIAPPCYPVRE